MSRISVIGLGKLGACMAACFASKGHEVVGVDNAARTVELVTNGQPPVYEPGLESRMAGGRARLTATTDTAAAVRDTEITFIVVPTPSAPDGGYSLEFVREAGKEIGRGLAGKGGYHLVVLTSTVIPGSTEGVLKVVLEEASGKRCGDDFGLCYNPEFIALGTVVRDFLNPDFVLIGESDPRAGAALEECLLATLETQAAVARLSTIDAEIAKIGVNTFLTAKIAFANTLAAVCDRTPGANVDSVTRAIGLDTRIGGKYLQGGMPFGGPCFPRDNRALSFVISQLGLSPTLPDAIDTANEEHLRGIVDFVRARVSRGPIAVLGLSYKPGSVVLDASPTLAAAIALSDAGYEVRIHDELLGDMRLEEIPEAIILSASLADVLHGAEAVIVGRPDGVLLQEHAVELLRSSGVEVILDCWRLLEDRAASLAPAHYVAFGKGPPQGGPARSAHAS